MVTAALCSVALFCLTLCHPVDWSLPGSSVHGVLQALQADSSLSEGREASLFDTYFKLPFKRSLFLSMR